MKKAILSEKWVNDTRSLESDEGNPTSSCLWIRGELLLSPESMWIINTKYYVKSFHKDIKEKEGMLDVFF